MILQKSLSYADLVAQKTFFIIINVEKPVVLLNVFVETTVSGFLIN